MMTVSPNNDTATTSTVIISPNGLISASALVRGATLSSTGLVQGATLSSTGLA
jgi:hypothetical protein